MRLENRIMLFSVLMMLGLLIAANTGIYYIFSMVGEDTELEETLDQGRSIASVLPGTIEENGDPSSAVRGFLPGDGMIRMIAPTGDPLFSVTTRTPGLTGIDRAYETRETAESITFNGGRYALVRTPVVWEDGRIVTMELVTSMASFEAVRRILLIVLIVSTIVAVIPVVSAGKILGRSLAAPVKNITRIMNHNRQEGGFRKLNLNRKTNDEMKEMEEAYNHMITLLEENDQKQRRFISDASHELRTPLTVIHSYARLLDRQGEERPDLVREAALSISGETTRLQEMMKQMLDLATGQDTVVQKTMVDPTQIVRSTVSGLQMSEGERILLKESAATPSHLFANEGQLRQLVYILLENALKYSENRVEVSMGKQGEAFVLSVKDRGIGIPEEDRDAVFDRFYRVDEARVRKNGGSGLGLAIAKQIVTNHQGEIHVSSTINEGSVFTVTLPIEKAGDAQ